MAHAYCCKWRLKANVSKSAVVVFTRELVEGSWNWGEQAFPRLSKYTYLAVDFTSNRAWDEHVKRVLQNGRKKISQVHSNRDIDFIARRLLLISVVRPTLEYGSEVWEGYKAQAAALESVMIGGAKRILGCSLRTVMRLFEVTWGWIHYRVVEIRQG